jgi:metallo-beta-lactamase family protein
LRAPAVLYDLRVLIAARKIPNIAVFVDGPLSIKGLEVHRKHSRDFPEADRKLAQKIDLFKTPRYAECMKKGASLRLDEPGNEPIIIISSSGMASGGRVLGHLKHALQGARNSVIFCGHQSEGTNGALLTTGEAKTIRIDDEEVTVRAHIENLEDYSAHGDYKDLMRWLSGFKRKPKKCFLVHGDDEAGPAFKARIEETLGWDVEIPDYRSFVELA